MRDQSLFGKEETIIEKFETILSSNDPDVPIDNKVFSELLEEYRSFLDQMKRLISISDRIEAKMNTVLHSKTELSDIDFLTDMYNRRFFDEAFKREWKVCLRDGNPLSLLLLDIDFFKFYNDSYGHLKGDNCLQAVSREIKSNVKRPRDIAARFGGEEFVILLPATQKEGARFLGERIKTTIESLKIIHETSEKFGVVTVSIGISSVIPNVNTTPELLISMADEQLYSAKAMGRNTVCG